MLKSMTGFGRAVADTQRGSLVVEIQSVNRKFLEIFVSLPREFSRFEQDVREWVAKVATRGQVSVRVFLTPSLSSLQTQLPDDKMLKELKAKWEKLALAIGTDPKEINLSFLIQNAPVIIAQEENKEPLEKCVQEALVAFSKMKEEEGKALRQDLQQRLQELKKFIESVKEFSSDATQKMKVRLKEKIEEVFSQPEAEDRLLKEVAIFAEKVDTTEEIVRFNSHIEQFQKLLNVDVAGRKMDFLLQEMGREVNTIGSKSMEAKIAHLVVALKSEMEKMREQVQNIE